MPGSLTLDPATNTIYAVDGGAKLGVFILHFLPDGDSGSGLIDAVNSSVLGPTCGIGVNQPTAASLGPDGNLYIGFRRSGNIMRVNAPTTLPLPCGNVQQTVIVTGDKLTSQIAWVGHSLFGNTSRLAFQVDQADQCLTLQNGNAPCVAQPFTTGLLTGGTTVIGDQTPGQSNGSSLYFGTVLGGSITAFDFVINAVGHPFVSTFVENYGNGAFANVGALALDTSDPANSVLYVGDDPTAGAVAGQGRWFQILPATPPPAPPSAPLNATATAGDGQATVSWNAPNNHQPVTSYTVHNSFAGNGVTVPDVLLVPAPRSTFVPTSATVTGLVDGVGYQFEIQASNAQGTGPLSAPTNTVTPQVLTVPGAATNVSAIAGDASAVVSWTAPSNGGSPITSYTVTALAAGVPAGSISVIGTATSTNVGLVNGTSYTFTVHATNAIGNGPESAPSAAVTPVAAPVANLGITMAGPSFVPNGGNAVYTLKVTNPGPTNAPAVTVTDNEVGATVSSVATTQGTCTTVAGAVTTCNLGQLAPGASATITITLKPTTQTISLATVSPSGNSASLTTNLSTDVQVVGSAQNGAPAITASDIFTWQIKNNQPPAATNLVFTATLAQGVVFQNVSSSLGAATCTAPPAGTNQVTCTLPSLAGGQTLVVTVNVTFSTAGSLGSVGSVTLDNESNSANNSSTITVAVK
jgi:Fibronectin type III domain/Domain of unknown function DUF11